MPVFLLVLFSVALSIGMGVVVLVIRRARPKRRFRLPVPMPTGDLQGVTFVQRPSCWLAVRSRSLLPVQAALGLSNPKPCSLMRGFTGEERLFIAPPVKGWVVVTGLDLPDPCEDSDTCFRFVAQLSRKLGQVQLFSSSRILHYHAWVRADRGRIQRAFAWAGRTLWKQGARTPAEKELDLKCPDYFETHEPEPGLGLTEVFAINAEKVHLLAARWSIDPGRIGERLLGTERGVSGQASQAAW